ncbi:MAG: restriction endonuclease subunit S [Ignavibacteriaceae bacterium]
MNVDKYSSYKESNIQWFGKIPKHWTMDRLKWSIKFCKNGAWGSEPDGIKDIACIRVADFDRIKLNITSNEFTLRAFEEKEIKDRLLKKEDLLIEKSGGGEKQLVGAVVQFNLNSAAVNSNFIARMPVENNFSSRFLVYLHYHLYSSKVNYRSVKQTTGIQNLDSQQYLDELVCYPPLPEQKSIADFLDYKTSQIDTLIEKKEKLLKFLEEKRIALITSTVTGKIYNSPLGRGLRGGSINKSDKVKLKPSNIPWLGDIPGNWKIKRLRFLLSNNFSNGIFKKREFWGEGIKIINVSDIYSKDFTINTNFLDSVSCTEEEYLNYKVKNGDFFFVRSSLKLEGIGQSASFISSNNKKEPLVFECHLIKGSPDQSLINPGYLNFYLNSSLSKNTFISEANTVTMTTIDQMKFKDCFICYPSLEEQEKIVEYLDTELEKIDSLSKKVEENIGYLKEYRTSLITSAVTGKIDVCNWQKPSLSLARRGTEGEAKQDIQTAEEKLK